MRRRYKIPLIVVAVLVGGFMGMVAITWSLSPDMSREGYEIGYEASKECSLFDLECIREVEDRIVAGRETARIQMVVAEAVEIDHAMYKDMLRYPDNYEGVPVKTTGSAITWGGGIVRVIWTSSWNYGGIQIDGNRLVDGGRVVDSDLITVYGTMSGISTIDEPVLEPYAIVLLGDAPEFEDCLRDSRQLGC